MIVTDALMAAIEKNRWTPDPESQALVNFIRDALVQPEEDGVSMLERTFRTCPYENQRNESIQAAGFAIIKKRFREKVAFFQADCPDDGRCRFHLRLADNHRDVQFATPAHADHFLNLLREPDAWIRPPEPLGGRPEMVLQKPAQPPKTESISKPKPARANMRKS